MTQIAATTDCPFLPAKQLGLKEKERDALIKTLLLMEAGKMKHRSRAPADRPISEGKYGFNMGVWKAHWDCGTVCCIGGTAELVGGLRHDSLGYRSSMLARSGKPDLFDLFYNYGGGSPPPERAARVLRSYLTTGKTKWW